MPSNPHYEPTEEVTAPIRSGDWVLLDMWAKLDQPEAVYYDITWTGFCGDQPTEEMRKVFGVVTRRPRRRHTARPGARSRRSRELRGFEVDDAARGSSRAPGTASISCIAPAIRSAWKFPGAGNGPLTIDLSTDRLVIWTAASQQLDVNPPVTQDQGQPLEIYMEGNVVFREGDRIIYADRMYYDVRHHLGTVLGADMLTPAPGYEGKVRLHADVLQQIDEDHFRAQDVFVTSSRLGIPRYRLQMGEAPFDDRPDPHVDWLGEPVLDPQNRPAARRSPGTGHGAEQLPVHRERSDLLLADVRHRPERSSFFLRRIQFKEDGVFGDQLYTDFAPYQLLGIRNRPARNWINLEISMILRAIVALRARI